MEHRKGKLEKADYTMLALDSKCQMDLVRMHKSRIDRISPQS